MSAARRAAKTPGRVTFWVLMAVTVATAAGSGLYVAVVTLPERLRRDTE